MRRAILVAGVGLSFQLGPAPAVAGEHERVRDATEEWRQTQASRRG